MKYINLLEAKEIYKKGKNITQYLRNKFNEDDNSSEIIEIAYDLLAGSYIEHFNNHRFKQEKYSSELAHILNNYVQDGDTLLDVGSGELTTLTIVLNQIEKEFSNVLAFDISWSRLKKGLEFYSQNIKRKDINLQAFVADIKAIPLQEKCVDIVTSSHALEPNGSNLSELLVELFRVVKRKLILFEPSYELNSKDGQKRMDSLGYVKNIEGEVDKLGGKVAKIFPVYDRGQPLNPTACFVIDPPEDDKPLNDRPKFCVPGTNFELNISGTFMVSKDTGLLFPVLDDIPIVRDSSAILATAKVERHFC